MKTNDFIIRLITLLLLLFFSNKKRKTKLGGFTSLYAGLFALLSFKYYSVPLNDFWGNYPVYNVLSILTSFVCLSCLFIDFLINKNKNKKSTVSIPQNDEQKIFVNSIKPTFENTEKIKNLFKEKNIIDDKFNNNKIN